MGFKLKSGNTTSFKLMGGTEQSPAKDMKTGSYKQSFEDSPAKHPTHGDHHGISQDKLENYQKLPEYDKDNKPVKKSPAKDMKTGKYEHSFESPAKQWKGTEGQDQDKIFNDKGEHVGDWVNGKKVMHVQKDPKDTSIKPKTYNKAKHKADRAKLNK